MHSLSHDVPLFYKLYKKPDPINFYSLDPVFFKYFLPVNCDLPCARCRYAICPVYTILPRYISICILFDCFELDVGACRQISCQSPNRIVRTNSRTNCLFWIPVSKFFTVSCNIYIFTPVCCGIIYCKGIKGSASSSTT